MFVRYPIGISNTTTPVLNTLYSSDIFNNSKVLSILSPVLFAYERTGLDCPDCPRENLGSKGYCLWKIHIITELCRIFSPIKYYFRILFDRFLRLVDLKARASRTYFPAYKGSRSRFCPNSSLSQCSIYLFSYGMYLVGPSYRLRTASGIAAFPPTSMTCLSRNCTHRCSFHSHSLHVIISSISVKRILWHNRAIA